MVAVGARGTGAARGNRVAVRHDDGGLEQIMVVVSLSFREVFSSRANRATPLGHAFGVPREGEGCRPP